MIGERKNEKKKLIYTGLASFLVIVFLLIFLVIPSLHIPFKDSQEFRLILNIPLNKSLVDAINITYANSYLESKNITFTESNVSIPEGPEFGFVVFYPNSTIYYKYVGAIYSNSSDAWLEAWTKFNLQDKDVETVKQRMKEIVDDIGMACDLTLNWDKAEWTKQFVD